MRSTTKKIIFSLFLALVLLLSILLLVSNHGGSNDTPGTEEPAGTSAPAETSPSMKESEPTAQRLPGIGYPYDFADGKLRISSLFQYSGMNPDADFEEGENIGVLVISNISQDYLEELTVSAAISDGTTLKFHISDLPAGQTVWAFAQNNGAFDPVSECVKVESQSSFTENPGLLSTNVDLEIQGLEVTLTNNTGNPLPASDLRCHIVLDDIYFGGTSYAYPVPALGQGDTVTVTAADCILGDVAVARLRPND